MSTVICAILASVAIDVSGGRQMFIDGTLVKPSDGWYSPARRKHDGIPSIAVSAVNGRMWATWYASPTGAEDSNNYLVLATSADCGVTWREAVIYEPDFQGPVRAFDPELWIAPDGRLRWTWTERTVPLGASGPYAGCGADPSADRLMMVEMDAEREPDIAALSAPGNLRQIARGVMMCKPIVTKDGAWLFPVAHWQEAPSACVYASTDGGRTFVERGGVTLPKEKRQFDEHNLVELRDGTLRAYIRTAKAPDGLWEAESPDGGRTWGEPRPGVLPHVNSRVFVRRLASGNLLMVKNGRPGDQTKNRRDMTAYLSCDDGKTWPFSLVLDAGRNGVSYPDGQQLADGRIVVVYDFDRMGSRQILFAVFREEDIMAGLFKTSGARPLQTVYCGNPASKSRKEPAVDISVGRQLFVDDFLVEEATNVVRHWNKPAKMEDPVVWPGGGAAPKSVDGSSGAKEGDGVNLTCATDGGLWWDPTRRKFRLWYQADWLGDICYAESDDGLKWDYPDLGIVPGTNRIFEHDIIDSWNVTPNYAAANPYDDWKLHISKPGGYTEDGLWESRDGIRFESVGLAGFSGDRSTSYYDPFRAVWVFSLRDYKKDASRYRRYFASRDFGGEKCRWAFWGKKPMPESYKDLEKPEDWLAVTNVPRKQLYSFDAVAYESLMLGVMEILYNTSGDNADCDKVGLPKKTCLHFCFSRDGKTYEPRTEADIAPEGWGSGKWDTGYLSAVGGICVIRDERLWFYYSGLRGDGERVKKGGVPWQRRGMYSNGAIGVATLRRDGFAGMVADARGELLTKPVVFCGKHLFVNAECRFGSVAAEIVGEDGKAVDGFSFDDCTAFAKADSTKTELRFRGGDLAALAGKPVRFRFRIHCGTLYSFWVSPSERGESRGYVAGGGPAYKGLRDL